MDRNKTIITFLDKKIIVVEGSATSIIEKCNTDFMVMVVDYRTKLIKGYRRDSIEKIEACSEKKIIDIANRTSPFSL